MEEHSCRTAPVLVEAHEACGGSTVACGSAASVTRNHKIQSGFFLAAMDTALSAGWWCGGGCHQRNVASSRLTAGATSRS